MLQNYAIILFSRQEDRNMIVVTPIAVILQGDNIIEWSFSAGDITVTPTRPLLKWLPPPLTPSPRGEGEFGCWVMLLVCNEIPHPMVNWFDKWHNQSLIQKQQTVLPLSARRGGQGGEVLIYRHVLSFVSPSMALQCRVLTALNQIIMLFFIPGSWL